MRAHLAECAGCRELEARLRPRPRGAGLLAGPLIPMLRRLLPAKASAGGTLAGGGLAGGLIGQAVLVAATIATVASVAAVATAVGRVYNAEDRATVQIERVAASAPGGRPALAPPSVAASAPANRTAMPIVRSREPAPTPAGADGAPAVTVRRAADSEGPPHTDSPHGFPPDGHGAQPENASDAEARSPTQPMNAGGDSRRRALERRDRRTSSPAGRAAARRRPVSDRGRNRGGGDANAGRGRGTSPLRRRAATSTAPDRGQGARRRAHDGTSRAGDPSVVLGGARTESARTHRDRRPVAAGSPAPLAAGAATTERGQPHQPGGSAAPAAAADRSNSAGAPEERGGPAAPSGDRLADAGSSAKHDSADTAAAAHRGPSNASPSSRATGT